LREKEGSAETWPRALPLSALETARKVALSGEKSETQNLAFTIG
jgi:hypothetical protein